MKRIIALILALCACIACTGCAIGRLAGSRLRTAMRNSSAFDQEQQIYLDTVRSFFDALDAGDAEAIRDLFSPHSRAADDDLDVQIEKLLKIYPAPTLINRDKDKLLASSHSKEGGRQIRSGYSTFPVAAGGEYFWCRIDLMYQNDADPSMEGITRVDFFTIGDYFAERQEYAALSFGKNALGRVKDDMPGLYVHADSAPDPFLTCIYQEPCRVLSGAEAIEESAVKAFFKNESSLSAFIAQFGNPHAEGIIRCDYCWRMKGDDGDECWLALGLHSSYSNEISCADAVDAFDWLRSVYKP